MNRYVNAKLSGAALTSLPLTPIEGFVLSRIEGESTEEDVALGTGLDETTVRTALDRLVELGAVRLLRSGSLMPAARPSFRSEVAQAPRASAPSDADPFTADERKLVDLLESRLFLGNHYVLLGVPLGADRRAIKDAYYELVALVHPDRFVGRDLGPHAARLHRIFGAIELAHEVLSNRDKRARYDESLEDAAEPETSPRITAIESQQHRLDPASPDSYTSSSRIAAAVGPSSGHMLARKLGRSPSVPPPPLSSSPPSSTQVPISSQSTGAGHAIAELRRRYEQLAPLAKAEKLKSLLSQGEQALADGHGAEALQAFKLAQAIDPTDTAVLRGLTRAEEMAAPEVGKNYAYFAKRAEYAEQTTDARVFWEEAAARAPDDATTQAKAAESLLRLEGTASAALRCAGRAVLLEPKNAAFRALLGRSYLRQGMLRNAEREAQAASELDASCSELAELRRELASTQRTE